jgi:hypothetical protein
MLRTVLGLLLRHVGRPDPLNLLRPGVGPHPLLINIHTSYNLHSRADWQLLVLLKTTNTLSSLVGTTKTLSPHVFTFYFFCWVHEPYHFGFHRFTVQLQFFPSVDAGPTRFPCETTTSHGPWPGPRTEAGKGATTATPNPSRIGQTSRTPIGKYLQNLDQNTFFGSD